METVEFDVVVIGAGAAGSTAAIVAAEAGARVALVSKEPVGYGNTRISGGEMASSGLAAEDGPEVVLRDMVVGGELINDIRLAEVVANEASHANRLIESFGQVFRRSPNGEITLDEVARPGGHQFLRSVTSPASGTSMGHALRAAIVRSGLTIYEDTMVTRLLAHRGEIQGAVALRFGRGEIITIKAPAVVMATGGVGALYFPRTTGMSTVTGDGVSLALDAGAELINMEMVQFLPFAIAMPGSLMTGSSIGDPDVAGPAGRLINRHGEVVLEQLENMTRAQVTRIIALEVQAGRGFDFGGLLLDMSENLAHEQQRKKRDRDNERGRWDRLLDAYGTAAYEWQEPWPVAPTAHYLMGGIRISPDAQSVNIKGLFAAGEVQGATYGANRLGSTSLAEAYVFGNRAGHRAAEIANLSQDVQFECDASAEVEAARITALFGAGGRHRPARLKRRLQDLAWERVGILKDEAGLNAALGEIEEIESCARDIAVGPSRRYNMELRDALEIPLMARTARAIAMSALIRQESRGAHLRKDFPERDDENWLRFTLLKAENSSIQLWTEDVPPWPSSLLDKAG